MPVDRLAAARERVEQLAARAQRLGAGRLALIDTGERTHLEAERAGRRVRLEHARVLLEGEPPRLADWRLIARLRHPPGGTVAEPLLGAELDDARWRAAEPRCEHCGLRRRRVETYLLKHHSGRLAQVGTSCLRDFTGHDPGQALRWPAAWWTPPAASAAEHPPRSRMTQSRRLPQRTTSPTLPRSRASAASPPSPNRTPSGQRPPNSPPTTCARAGAARPRCACSRATASARGRRSAGCAARSRARPTWTATNGSGSRWSPARPERHELPLAASALLAHERSRRPESGPLGARIDVEQALLEGVRPGPETRFGLRFAHSFRDQQGRRLVCSRSAGNSYPASATAWRATVKRHGSQRGETVTVLTRCRCEWLPRERETPAA